MSWNQQIIKMNNKSLVLHTIKEQAPLSRADIAQRLGLTKGTVSSLVQELVEEHMCYESGPGESSGGRRPVMLLFNERAGFSIGIDVGVNYILGVLTDLHGKIMFERRQPVKKGTYEQTLSTIKEMIHSLIQAAPDSPYGIIGIGVGVPGIVDHDGRVLLAPNLHWHHVHLKQDIEAEFNLPIIIDNEANAGAYGEKRFGAGIPFDHLVYVSAGIGIGVGFILNGELYRGSHGFSGEMGHMMIELNGRTCSCGSSGCWELYASEQALLAQAEQVNALAAEDISLEGLVEAAGKHEPLRSLFQEIGGYLGVGMTNIINTFNPQQIIIGNRLAMAKDWLEPALREVIQQHALTHNQAGLQIAFSSLSYYSTALGASAYVIEHFFNATPSGT